MSARDDLIYLVEINAYDPDAEEEITLRYCDGLGKITAPSETPPNVAYENRLTQPINVTRTMFSDSRVLGGAQLAFGEIRLNNADKGLSSLFNLGFDGRTIVVRVGPPEAAYPSGYAVLLTGAAEGIEADDKEVVIRVRDKLAILDQPIQTQRYGGTNVLPDGVDGVEEDLKDVEKAQAFGKVFHVEPQCVNTARLIYDLHSRPDGSAAAIYAVDAIYDKGKAVTIGVARANQAAMDANEPDPDKADYCLATGRIRFGYQPAGKVTVDYRGEATGSYPNKVAGIIKRILSQAGIPSGEIDDASFTAIDTAAPYEAGVFVPGGATRKDVIERLAVSIGAYVVPDRLGIWKIGQLVAPSGDPVVTLTNAEIMKISLVATDDKGKGIPVKRVTLKYKKYNSTFTESDLAGDVLTNQALTAELKKEWRTTSQADLSVVTKHILAPELERETCLTSASDAATERDRQLALHKVRRDFVKATVRLDELNAELDLGSIVKIEAEYFDYASGRLFVVVGITTDGRAKETNLDLWG